MKDIENTTPTTTSNYPTPELIELTRHESGAMYQLGSTALWVGSMVTGFEHITPQTGQLSNVLAVVASGLFALGVAEAGKINFAENLTPSKIGEYIWSIGSRIYDNEYIQKGLDAARKAHIKMTTASVFAFITWGIAKVVNPFEARQPLNLAGIATTVAALSFMVLGARDFYNSMQYDSTSVEVKKNEAKPENKSNRE